MVDHDRVRIGGVAIHRITNDAAWVRNDTLYLAGGKYSEMEGGVSRFIYRNDVWRLTRPVVWRISRWYSGLCSRRPSAQ
jgi:hypothetical protein